MLAGEMSEEQQQTSAMCGQSGMEGAATKRGTAARRHDAIMYASAAGHRAMAELLKGHPVAFDRATAPGAAPSA
jgi:hypothetical protein